MSVALLLCSMCAVAQDVMSLCTISEAPKSYAGKTVTVKAVLHTNEEYWIVNDDSCPENLNPISGRHDLIEATINNEQYDSKSPTHKKRVKRLKKTREVQIVVIAKFIDPGVYGGSGDCCRYRLEIQNLISVEEVPKSKARHVSCLGRHQDHVIGQRAAAYKCLCAAEYRANSPGGRASSGKTITFLLARFIAAHRSSSAIHSIPGVPS